MKRLGLGLTAVLMVSCASLDIHRATSPDEVGLRFYRPWPYLWITVGQGGECVPSIVYLPNPKEEYVIVPKPGIGVLAFKPTLQDGWNLTAFDANIDNTKVVEQLNTLGQLVKGLAAKGQGKRVLVPGLYRFKFDETGFVQEVQPVLELPSDETTCFARPSGGSDGGGK